MRTIAKVSLLLVFAVPEIGQADSAKTPFSKAQADLLLRALQTQAACSEARSTSGSHSGAGLAPCEAFQQVLAEIAPPSVDENSPASVAPTQPSSPSKNSASEHRSAFPVTSSGTASTIQPVTAAYFSPVGNVSLTSRDFDPAKPQFAVTTSTENSQASVKASRILSAENDHGTATFSTLSAAISAPVSKGDKNYTNIATLDGLTNSFALTLAYSNYIVNDLLQSPVDDDGNPLPGAVEICKSVGIDIDKEQCDTNTVKSRLLAKGDKTTYANFLGYFFKPNATRWAYGAKASVGYDSYDYFTAKTLAGQTSHETPWSVGAYIGVKPAGWSTFLSSGIEFQRSYKAAKVRTLCPSAPETDPVVCVSGSIGSPVLTDKRLLYIDGRRLIGSTAFDLRLTHDFASGDNGADLPVYLFGDGKSPLNGGLRFGWTNTDHFLAGIFVGAPFSVAPQ